MSARSVRRQSSTTSVKTRLQMQLRHDCERRETVADPDRRALFGVCESHNRDDGRREEQSDGDCDPKSMPARKQPVHADREYDRAQDFELPSADGHESFLAGPAALLTILAPTARKRLAFALLPEVLVERLLIGAPSADHQSHGCADEHEHDADCERVGNAVMEHRHQRCGRVAQRHVTVDSGIYRQPVPVCHERHNEESSDAHRDGRCDPEALGGVGHGEEPAIRVVAEDQGDNRRGHARDDELDHRECVGAADDLQECHEDDQGRAYQPAWRSEGSPTAAPAASTMSTAMA